MLVLIYSLLIISFLITAGLSDYSVSITGFLVCLNLCIAYFNSKSNSAKSRNRNKGEVCLGLPKDNLLFYLPVIAVIIAFIVSFWAVDYSTNLLGCMRQVVILLWAYTVYAYLGDEVDRIILQLPLFSASSVILGIIINKLSLTIPFFTRYFISKRFSGPFQYANTMGMLLLMTIIIGISKIEHRININAINAEKGENAVLGKRTEYIFDIIILLINIIGFVLTGSRSSMLIMLLYLIYKMIMSKKLRLLLTGAMILLLLSSIVDYFILGNTQNVGRLFTLSNNSSTLTVWGRTLYYIDGFNCLIKHPFGLGYLGYEYLQGMYQTGLYQTKFVHNDILQFAIDYGFIPAILIVIYFAYQILKGRQGLLKKELMVVLLLGSLVDFHLQYLFMGMILVLLLDMDAGKKNIDKKLDKKSDNRLDIKLDIFLYAAISCVIFIYASVLFISDNLLLNYDFALKLGSEYSQCQEKRLEKMDDFDIVNNLSDALLKKNAYNPKALAAKVVIYELIKDYESMCDAMERSLDVSKYNIELYREYNASIDEILNECDEDTNNILIDEKNRIEQRLQAVKENTNPIAYRLCDIDLELYKNS